MPISLLSLVRPVDTQIMLDELQIALRILPARPSIEIVRSKQLAGLPLVAEIARETERTIFLAARAQYFARSDGTLDSDDRAQVDYDQRLYEQAEFTGPLRLERTGMGVLPSYVVAAHRDVVHLPRFRFAQVA